MNRKKTILNNIKNGITRLPVNNAERTGDYTDKIIKEINKAVDNGQYLTSNEKKMVNDLTRRVVNEFTHKGTYHKQVKNMSTFNDYSNKNSVINAAVLKVIDSTIDNLENGGE
ncbi:hypothetical protein ERX35_000965 [Macrococcus equipercicus]|uniref:Uncharacterized protein n=1 Tax=Macrococcus equipercicus TaxID=69967 RepID=A0ABQ6RB68_9STAP|nr:hypothetical protein [Macrococcus equipercicus]KAA1042483.1 hypothetical protein ERX35_000965 [Macrococcus equipercicus]